MADAPKPQNLQQVWPEAERAWLKERAASLAITETEYLLALVRREGHRGGEIGIPLEDYLRKPSKRTARDRARRIAAHEARKAGDPAS